jgi:hypothetical protein
MNTDVEVTFTNQDEEVTIIMFPAASAHRRAIAFMKKTFDPYYDRPPIAVAECDQLNWTITLDAHLRASTTQRSTS